MKNLRTLTELPNTPRIARIKEETRKLLDLCANEGLAYARNPSTAHLDEGIEEEFIDN